MASMPLSLLYKSQDSVRHDSAQNFPARGKKLRRVHQLLDWGIDIMCGMMENLLISGEISFSEKHAHQILY
jgi:hypothetical protein